MRWTTTTYIVFWSAAMLISIGIGAGIWYQLRQQTLATRELIQTLRSIHKL